MSRFERAIRAIREAQRDAEKEATRLEITQPALAAEARGRADGLSDARRIIEGMDGLQAVLANLSEDA